MFALICAIIAAALGMTAVAVAERGRAPATIALRVRRPQHRDAPR